MSHWRGSPDAGINWIAVIGKNELSPGATFGRQDEIRMSASSQALDELISGRMQTRGINARCTSILGPVEQRNSSLVTSNGSSLVDTMIRNSNRLASMIERLLWCSSRRIFLLSLFEHVLSSFSRGLFVDKKSRCTRRIAFISANNISDARAVLLFAPSKAAISLEHFPFAVMRTRRTPKGALAIPLPRLVE